MRPGGVRKDCYARNLLEEFERDVVRVARRGDRPLTAIAVDVSAKTLYRWVAQADVDDAVKDWLTTAEQAEIVQLCRRARQLEMENEILRRAAVTSLGKCSQKMYPLVRELAAEQIPARLTCRVLGFSPQAFYKWLKWPVLDTTWCAVSDPETQRSITE